MQAVEGVNGRIRAECFSGMRASDDQQAFGRVVLRVMRLSDECEVAPPGPHTTRQLSLKTPNSGSPVDCMKPPLSSVIETSSRFGQLGS
jgi:hypothetical protein